MKTEGEKVKVCEEDDSPFCPRGINKIKTNKRYERWNLEENRDYVAFLKNNAAMFNDPVGRRSTAIYNKMAVELDNGRNNHQCRSHHMKMLKKYSTLDGIINHILDDPRLQKKEKGPSEQRKSDEGIFKDLSSSEYKREANLEAKIEQKQPEYKVKKSDDETGSFGAVGLNRPEFAFPFIRTENIVLTGPGFAENRNSRNGQEQSVSPFFLNRFSSAFKLVQMTREPSYEAKAKNE